MPRYRNKIDIIDIPNKMILKKVVYTAFKSGKMKIYTTIYSSLCNKNHYLDKKFKNCVI